MRLHNYKSSYFVNDSNKVADINFPSIRWCKVYSNLSISYPMLLIVEKSA